MAQENQKDINQSGSTQAPKANPNQGQSGSGQQNKTNQSQSDSSVKSR